MKKSLILACCLLPMLCLYAQEFTSSNLPIVIIDTEQPVRNEPKVNATMRIIYNGEGQANRITDSPNNYDGNIGIEHRGSSSRTFPKKQYGIELRDQNGADRSASLLGLPEEEDWILFAPYNDKTLMRDVLSYELGRRLGQYAPRTRYVELVMNGVYDGVYVLIEKIKRDKGRVNISKLEPGDVSGDALTGGYIVKIDKTTAATKEYQWVSPYAPENNAKDQAIIYQIEYPAVENVQPQQQQYIQAFVTDFEAVMASENYTDVNQGYHKYIDVRSFIDYMIAMELTKNPDGYRISTFMHKKKDSEGGKLHMGPIWDFNLAFGNITYCTRWETTGFVYDFNTVCSTHPALIPFWWNRLLQDEYFADQLHTRWSIMRRGKYSTESILASVDSAVTVLDAGAQQRNFERWPVLGVHVWPNAFVGETFEEEIDHLKSWIAERLEWLDSHWLVEVTSVEPETREAKISLFPNPTSDKLSIVWEPTLQKTTVEIQSLLGQTAYAAELEEGVGEHIVDTTAFADGVYVVNVRQGSKSIARRMIKAAR